MDPSMYILVVLLFLLNVKLLTRLEFQQSWRKKK